jgi:outer membrane protein TolC
MSHPAINAANARIDAREAGVDFAELNLKPAWAFDLGYGHRNGRLPNGDPRSDFISLSVSMDLPVLRKNRQSRHLSAALSERRAAHESKEELVRRLNSQLEAEYARWIDLNRHIKLYETQILSLADENAQSALRAYQSDAGDFADVMRGYIDSINARVEHIRLQVDRAQSFAVLANLGGLRR